SGTQQYLGVSNFAGTNTIHSVIADNTRLDEETVIYDRRMGVWVTGRGTLVLTAANTYTSSTVIQGLRDFGGWEKLGFGTLKLDFSDPNAPTSNILYNGVAAGAFQSSGGTLLLQGKDGAANSQ
ncbi:MAG: hypothetical protein FWD53_06080, partial [Phycisphaerales bacterium]|nr:hypothetical protein [Phycisphaerales bacterium]